MIYSTGESIITKGSDNQAEGQKEKCTMNWYHWIKLQGRVFASAALCTSQHCRPTSEQVWTTGTSRAKVRNSGRHSEEPNVRRFIKTTPSVGQR